MVTYAAQDDGELWEALSSNKCSTQAQPTEDSDSCPDCDIPQDAGEETLVLLIRLFHCINLIMTLCACNSDY